MFLLKEEYIINNRNNVLKPIYFRNNYTGYKPIIIEKWLPVNIEGVVKNYYLISNTGMLKNIKGQIIKPIIINTGYYTYKLYTGTKPKYKTILVHRLVMMTFNPIENPEKYTINHINMNVADNNIYNLEWCSQEENNQEKITYYHSYGSNIYNSLFSIQDLPIIVNEINKGTKYKEILKMLGKEVTKNNMDYIGNIKRGITYQRELKELGLKIRV